MVLRTLHWKLVIITTLFLYALMLLSFPFSSTFATIVLFALIAYWSRLPGASIPLPFFILYQADVVDIFTLFIAIHVHPIYAVGFTIFCNLASRLAGVFPKWQGVFQDAIIQSSIALLSPFLFVLVGQKMIVMVVVYSILRILGFVVLGFIWPLRSIPRLFIEESGAAVALLIINLFYAQLFGGFFENLIQERFQFSWTLFIAVTFIILIFAIRGYQFSPGKILKRIARRYFSRKKRRKLSFDPIYNSKHFDDIRRNI